MIPGPCSLILNVGLMCLWSLLQAAERLEHFDTWAFEGCEGSSGILGGERKV